ncbi:hypothetical protein ACFO1B_45140 [Dactylosporangium siamense]|uniref:Ankyrin repeat domain-containing protein n=1 Tax=Dactylosporangium siamense TaxID=685454 RepID=A0A919PZC9_9ACTN|nr:hypothetical protein [Dactylosporangium siamense]GIG51348.1 hypothetical protein Dsi01nite_093890 [Dactylosporangium siamense]
MWHGRVSRELRGWHRVRRFTVPRWMIEEATRRRLAGDWRGACDAAGVDVALDLARIRRDHGAAVAAAVEDDVRHLAPDLLRWHLIGAAPATALRPVDVRLAGYGPMALRIRPRHPGTPSRRLELVFTERAGGAPQDVSPDRSHDQSQGLSQDLLQDLSQDRERWDSRHAGALLDRCGGYDGHLPFFTATGDRLPEAAWTDRERVIAAQDAGDWVRAWNVAGFDVRALQALVERGHWIERHLRESRPDLAQVRAAVGEIRTGRRDRVRVGLSGGNVLGFTAQLSVDADLRVSYPSAPVPQPDLPVVRAERVVDFDLVRLGLLPMEQLHPLVGDALFPGLAGLFEGPPDPVPDLAPVRVRCQGVWHVLGDGHHTGEEMRRELALRALGGAPLRGCFAARAGWRAPDAWTPKVLRLRRRDIVLHAVNGDAPAIAAWLDAGLDPHLRDHLGRTLLHLIAWLPDPEPVVTRLRHAGLDPRARDRAGRTPTQHAVAEGGTPQAIRALRELAS